MEHSESPIDRARADLIPVARQQTEGRYRCEIHDREEEN
jgi:hypothetical protein